jgi:uncharacterized protein (TIGR02268 family)
MVEATCQGTPLPANLGGYLAMLASLPLLSALVAATPGMDAFPGPPTCEAVSAVELLPDPGAPAPVLCISPQVATTLHFDTLLLPGAVEVQATEQEVHLAQGPQVVTLLPAAWLVPGEWRKLTLRFGGGAAPAVSTILLYVHPALAARQVEVRRRARTVESYQLEVKEGQERAHQLAAENAQLRAAAQDKPEGLRGLVSVGLMGEGGIPCANLRHPKELVRVRKGSALNVARVLSYRSRARVAVELRLELLMDGAPWVAAGAALVDALGKELSVLPLWQAAPIGPMGQTVVVEAEAPEAELHGPYTLKLWEAAGARGVTVEAIAFPPLPTTAAE